ncbi:hypothetical protein BDW22DRAFT_1352753 [Trametopsis cervina]|nr:hypothetical protein BDW22DRAFT_1352753 [Trametopsis cervina]
MSSHKRESPAQSNTVHTSRFESLFARNELDRSAVTYNDSASTASITQEGSYTSQFTTDPYHTPNANVVFSTADIPPNVIISIMDGMSGLRRSLNEGLRRLEDVVAGEPSRVSQRIDRLEGNLNADRTRMDQDSTRIVDCLDNISRVTLERLKTVGDRIERVESKVELLINNPSRADDFQAAMTLKMENMESLLLKLVENSNESLKAKTNGPTLETAVNTDVIEQVDIGSQSLSPSEGNESTAGTSAQHIGGTDAQPRRHLEVGTDTITSDLIQTTSLVSSSTGTDDGMRSQSPTDQADTPTTLVNHTPEQHSTNGAQDTSCPHPTSNITANPTPQVVFSNAESQPESLRPATWQEDTPSELSSRSTTPGCTVNELRQLLFNGEKASAVPTTAPQAVQGGSPSASSSSPDTPQRQHDPVRPGTSSLASLFPTLSTRLFPPQSSVPLSAENISGDVDSAPVGGSSQDDEETVQGLLSPPASPSALSNASQGHSAQPGNSNSQKGMAIQQEGSTLGPSVASAPSAIHVPLRRQRSASLDSLSSLSSLSSSNAPSDSEEDRPLWLSCGTGRQEQTVAEARRRRQSSSKRRERKRSSAGSTSTAHPTRKRKKKRRTNDDSARGVLDPKNFNLVLGYSGPSNWPAVINNDATRKDFIKCDGCDCWYHWNCVGIREVDPRANADDVPFTCPPCEISINMHHIARKVVFERNEKACARPGCTFTLDSGEYFLERLIARVPRNLNANPPIFEWLFKWADYPVKEATWEPDSMLPSGREKYIEEFEEAARSEKLPLQDLKARLLLAEAKEGGWC